MFEIFSEVYKSYGNLKAKGLALSLDDDKTKKIWDAFGQIVARSLKQGKGLWIPKFGQFTFTSVTVDLAGSTNPIARDT